ncbi:AraC family transcriptional regulator [Smaragdicoccus niigatensis]|uniref:AraC family transcriptional regulator n=1 Tax=Smaragdicoccus niigatensis TaxID=359359 RepID=UPI00058E5901|nr:AraC family transcriptional regulator [Smaragdicoccus niigatensis]
MPVFAAAEVPHWDFPRNPASVGLLVDCGVEHGLSPDDLLEGSGLTEPDLANGERMVGARQELVVVGNLLRLLDNPPGLGLSIGAKYHASMLGIFGFACLTSPTLGDAVRVAARYFELSFAFCLPTIEVSGSTASLKLALPDISGPVAEFLTLRDLTSMAMVMSDIVGTQLPLETLSFGFPARESLPEFELFDVTPQYGAPQTSATFSADLLALPLPQASPMTVAMCEAQCEELVMRRRSRSGVARLVREQLVKIDGSQHTIGRVARALTMSERTLRRRLDEENTSFRQLTDEVHRTLAEELLVTGALSVDDVAVRLGYAEASSFINAFKRWTGTTPARFMRETDGPVRTRL